MDDKDDTLNTPDDGRPVEVREGKQPQSKEEAEEDIPDDETVESVGY